MAGALTLDSWPGPSGFTTASYFDRFLEQMQFGMPGDDGILPSQGDEILGTYSNDFKVIADSSGMQVKVNQGRTSCKGVFAELQDSAVTGGVYALTVTTAHATLYRIDTVIVRYDISTGAATLQMLDGTAAAVASAAPTALTQSATTWDIPLAYVMVDPAVSTISVKDVADCRVFAPTVAELARIKTHQNPIINGGMDIWQRGTSFAAAADATYTADRWRYGKAGAVVHTVAQSADVPSVAANVQKDSFSLHLDVTTADASIAAGDYSLIEQRIEGYRAKQVLQRGFTLSFWIKDTIPGWHAVSFVNSGGDRSCVCEYFVSVANTWELKFVHVPASPTAGTWDYTTGIGLRVIFTQAAGTTFHATTPGAWETGLFYGTARTVNSNSSTSNDFLLWGVMTTPGMLVLPFSPHDDEETLCDRYYVKTFPRATAPAQNVGSFTGSLEYLACVGASGIQMVQWFFPTRMRTAPTIATYNPSAANTKWRNSSIGPQDSGTPTASMISESSVAIYNTHTGSDIVSSYMHIHAAADAEL